jgi:thioesterase domain-containing protein
VTEAQQQLDMINAGMEQLIPRAHQMGVRFIEVRPGLVRSSVPFEGNGNHFGVMYAGVVFTVAEVLGGAMHFATFDATTHYPLVRSLTIDFLKPGRGDLVASASLDEATIERVRAEAATGVKAAFVLEAEVVGEDGIVVAKTHGDYQIRPFGN